MPGRLPEFTRSAIIQKWLEGKSRNQIAIECNVSQGAVSGTIDDWKKSVGVSLAEQLRDLLLAVGRSGISVVECAQGYRTFRMLSNLHVDEDKAGPFLGETVNRCIGIGISPEDIASHLQDLASFADDTRKLGIDMQEAGDYKDNDRAVSKKVRSLSQIASYLEKTKEEIGKSLLKKKQLQNECDLLQTNKSSITRESADMLKKRDITAEKLDWYLGMRTELLVSGFSEKDFELVLKAINFSRKKGFNLLAIAAEFSEYGRLKSSIHTFNVQLSILERKFREVEERIAIGEQMIESKSQLQRNMVQLESMGFGLKQLRRLLSVIKEINEANGFSETDGYAVKIFLDHVERYYDSLLGFEKRAGELKAETNNLQIQYLGQVNIMSAIPYVGSALVYLLNKGLQVDQILKLAKLSQTHPDIIQPFIRSEGEQEKHDDFPKSTSSTHFSFSPPSSSSSFSAPPTQPHSPSSFQSQPQKTAGLTLQKSASIPPVIEPKSTVTITNPSVYKVGSSDKESDVQPFAQIMPEKQPPPMKVQYDFPRIEADVSIHSDENPQPLEMRRKENNKEMYKVNSNSLTRTATIHGKQVSIPNSILLGI
ncbi:MAG: hypothetical protein ACRD4W_02660 [Nitrososphaeraceae archaeon]